MGEVYRARDPKLNRDVALKVLPDDFADDPERLARFKREAQVLASLNHPNIAAIYGLEDSGETHALVLELVEGPTLQDRIAQGAIPLDEALPIAKQIAEALEAAHEQGIIHRDLKPANIKVTPEGVVKVLDFGLAKALEPEQTEAEAANSPTMTAAATKMGVLMGTAAYMSPEQARGKPVDRRADIWAFGVVLYEMLAGRPLFASDDISLTLADVMRAEPAWDSLPDAIPQTILTVLRRCLEKEPRQRVQAIGDVRLAMEGAFESAGSGTTDARPVAQPAMWQRPVPALLAVLGAALLTGLAVWTLTRTEQAPPRVGRFILTDQGNEPVTRSAAQPDVALSPDGTTVVYMAGQSNEMSSLTVRAVDQLVGVPLDATVAPRSFNPFFSPDGEWVGYLDFDTVTLNKVSIHGGPAIVLCEVDSDLDGASWSVDDTIIFGTRPASGLWRVSAGGGEPEARDAYSKLRPRPRSSLRSSRWSRPCPAMLESSTNGLKSRSVGPREPPVSVDASSRVVFSDRRTTQRSNCSRSIIVVRGTSSRHGTRSNQRGSWRSRHSARPGRRVSAIHRRGQRCWTCNRSDTAIGARHRCADRWSPTGWDRSPPLIALPSIVTAPLM